MRHIPKLHRAGTRSSLRRCNYNCLGLVRRCLGRRLNILVAAKVVVRSKAGRLGKAQRNFETRAAITPEFRKSAAGDMISSPRPGNHVGPKYVERKLSAIS